MDLYFYVVYIAHIVPLIMFSLNIKLNKTSSHLTVFVYCLYALLNDLVRNSELISHLIPNLAKSDFLLLSTFTIIEYTLLAYYIYNLFKNKTFKRVLLIASCIFLVIAFGNLILEMNSNTPQFDSVPIAISSLILITASIFYFFESIQDPDITFIYSKPSFWVVVGIMIYFSGTFFLFLQYDNLSEEDKNNYWIISIICFVLKNIFFSISFILKPENQQVLNADEYYLNKLE